MERRTVDADRVGRLANDYAQHPVHGEACGVVGRAVRFHDQRRVHSHVGARHVVVEVRDHAVVGGAAQVDAAPEVVRVAPAKFRPAEVAAVIAVPVQEARSHAAPVGVPHVEVFDVDRRVVRGAGLLDALEHVPLVWEA